MTAGPGAPRAGQPPRAGRREWTGLAVLALPCLLYAMDLTVLNLAIPAISKSLRPSGVELLWIVDIYGFVLAGSLITMGTLGDRIGRRRLLLAGAAGFAAASVLAAYATSPGLLIAARALLGVAGATLAPSTLSLISTMFADPGQRLVAIGVWISAFSAGGAIGPLFYRYFLIQGVCGMVGFGTALGWMSFGRLHRVRVGIVGLALVLALAGWPLANHVSELRGERNEVTDMYLKADSTRADELRPKVVEARHRFFVWHQVSLFSSLATVALVIAATSLAGQLPAAISVPAGASSDRMQH